jgi:hypothetical protein
MSAMVVTVGCASIGTPTGGPRDETPPRLMKANPLPGAVNVDRKNIVLEFDEIVNVKDAFSNVVISPTGTTTPRVTALGKKVTVAFTDTLAANTTYTIDFANSIQDNNESNALENFTYSFSTGDAIDTLRISGMVLGARDLEPQQHIIVGIHSVEADTTFRTVKLERIAKTDDRGRFSIRGLKPGNYHIYALADINNDYRWDNPEEDIAFLNYTLSPSAKPITVVDTIYNLETALPDSTVLRATTQFLPNDILLSSFNVGYKPQYLASSSRTDSTQLQLLFNAPNTKLPEVKILNHDTAKDWALIERSAKSDSITFWLRDPKLVATDTLSMEVKYLRNKSMGVFEEATDTLSFIHKRAKVKKENKPKHNKENGDSVAKQIKFLTMASKGGTTQEVNMPRLLEFATPPDTILRDRMHLEYQKDTVWLPIDDAVLTRADTLNPRIYKYDHKWDYDTSYRIVADSVAVTDIYGLFNKPEKFTFKTRKEEEYGLLVFAVTGIPDSIPVIVELLNSSDNPIRYAKVEGGKASFPYLVAGTYYARLYEDINDNGIYDTGDYDTRTQPEVTSYYPKKVKLKKNWDMELTWDVNTLPVDKQKPDNIKKNNPTSDKRNKSKSETDTDEEDEDEDGFNNSFNSGNSSRSSSSRRSGGINGPVTRM